MKRVLLCMVLVGCAALAGGCGRTESAPTFGGYAADGRALGHAVDPVRTPNLIVLVIDSLRHDALLTDPATGEAARMPFLSSLASRGVAFENATSAAPWTLPSLATLLTGLRPSQHGMNTMEARVRLPGSVTTFAEILKGAYGYETAAFHVGPWFGKDGESVLQGFGYVRGDFALQGLRREVLEWSQVRDPRRPFLLFLHTYEAHDPYGRENHTYPAKRWGYIPHDMSLDSMRDPKVVTRAAFLDRKRFTLLQRAMGQEVFDILYRYMGQGFAEDPDLELAGEFEEAYWRGVRWTDGLIEQAYAQLEEAGLLENTVFVVTADHGEAFGEHGFLGHGRNLYDESIRVPLVVVGPPPFSGGRTIGDGVGLIDLLPTFLDFAGMPPLGSSEGLSVLPLARGESMPCRAVISEERLRYANTRENVDVLLLSARSPQWKYVVHYDVRTGEVREEAYDLANDPEELFDLADVDGVLHGDLVFDGCLCGAVTALRDGIWAVGEEGSSAASVYRGLHEAHPTTPAPPPCNAEVD